MNQASMGRDETPGVLLRSSGGRQGRENKVKFFHGSLLPVAIDETGLGWQECGSDPAHGQGDKRLGTLRPRLDWRHEALT